MEQNTYNPLPRPAGVDHAPQLSARREAAVRADGELRAAIARVSSPLAASCAGRLSDVVIVEDCGLMRRALELAVQRMGYPSAAIASSVDALHVIVERPPKVVLLDFRMPAMNGAQLLGALRAALPGRAPAVVFVSATPEAQVREATAGLGPHGYLAKPFHLDELREAIEAGLRSSTSRPRPSS
jgi:DNA-binding response OmpR family regulator